MARENWEWIRLLLSDLNVTYSEVVKMDTDEVLMLNEALDLAAEMEEKRYNKVNKVNKKL